MRRIAKSCHNFYRQFRETGSQWQTRTPITRCLSTGSIACSTSLQLQANFATVAQHQVRKYAPTAGQAAPTAAACWNCKKLADRKSHMICAACGHLQDVSTDINYFDLLDCPKSFGLKSQELTRSFRQLQTLVHPDKFSNKSSREQTNSADWSSLINKAYKTLSIPIERGQYMLRLHGQHISEDNSTLNKEFLMEMVERNEEVEEANSRDELQRLNERISEELNQKVVELGAEFETNALDAAKAILVEMKYLLSIQQTIKNKLQTLLGH